MRQLTFWSGPPSNWLIAGMRGTEVFHHCAGWPPGSVVAPGPWKAVRVTVTSVGSGSRGVASPSTRRKSTGAPLGSVSATGKPSGAWGLMLGRATTAPTATAATTPTSAPTAKRIRSARPISGTPARGASALVSGVVERRAGAVRHAADRELLAVADDDRRHEVEVQVAEV